MREALGAKGECPLKESNGCGCPWKGTGAGCNTHTPSAGTGVLVSNAVGEAVLLSRCCELHVRHPSV